MIFAGFFTLVISIVYHIIGYGENRKNGVYFVAYGASLMLMSIFFFIPQLKFRLDYFTIGLILLFVARLVFDIRFKHIADRVDVARFRMRPRWLELMMRYFFPFSVLAFAELLPSYEFLYPLTFVLFERLTYPIFCRTQNKNPKEA